MSQLKQFIEKHGVNDKLMVYCLSVGLRNLNDEEEKEIKEDAMKKFSLDSGEKIKAMISELDDLCWKV